MLGPIGAGIVVASAGAAVGALLLLRYLYGQRDAAGAAWFMGNIASVAIFCFCYGGSLLVSSPPLRTALEAVSFASVSAMGPFFLAFGLDYTGRGDLIRSPAFAIVGAVPLLTTGLAVTNSAHRLVWTDLQFDPVFGLSTVTYAIQPWGVFALLFSIGTAAVGSLLLIGAVLSYGPMYRREATAVILSTVPPTTGVLLWLSGIGPLPQLHLTAPLMLVHIALDAYAFVGTHMFETNPATQRLAERTGLDSLSDPVLVLDRYHQIVRMNDRARDLFGDALPGPLPVPLAAAVGVDVETLRAAGEVELDASTTRTLGVSYTPLEAPSGDTAGSMIVLYDVTEERQREQQLAVLNRVVRHNLRNEMTVINGYARMLEDSIDDADQSAQAGTIGEAGERVLSIARKVREFESVQSRTTAPETLTIAEVLADVERDCSDAVDDATIEWTVTPPEITARTDPVLLSILLENLVQNALVHTDATTPTVTIRAFEPSGRSGTVAVEVSDANDPIPDIEIDSLRTGEETPLQHGQGVGLWIVHWCTRKLNATLEFEYDGGNRVTVTLPEDPSHRGRRRIDLPE
jgi:signal transduction histidine kinase